MSGMSSTREVGEVLRRVAEWGLCCSVVAAVFCLDLATASDLHPRHPDGDEICQSQEQRDGREKIMVTEDPDPRAVLGAEVIRRIRALDTSLQPSSEKEPTEEHYESRPSRSPHKPSDDHLKCLVMSSCSVPTAQGVRDVANMFPCMCDDDCYQYGDCCYDHASVSKPPPALRPACKLLTPMAGRHYTLHRSVFLVNRCPAETEPQLVKRCLGEASPSHMTDIPVFSRTSGIGYSNIFCAMCHNDTDTQKFEMSISCIGTVNSTKELENMIYHAGELRWSSPENTTEDTEALCQLDVEYPPSIGRWCQSQLVDTCREDWPIEKNVRRCSAYNYYVQSNNYVYKNRDCAICNAVPEDEIECLSLFKLNTRFYFPPPHSLMELFQVEGNCKDDEVWDVLYRRCEHVSCGFLFTLVDGKCERSDIATPRDGRSYLNASCYVVEYRQNLSTIFPNQSIYLNETKRLYHFDEYEFNGSWVRVCDYKEHWTPFMHIMSSVLIIISLVCLVLHMIIFIMLPKRRNIPSMNLFSMTVSLFMAEFIYLTFFQLKIQSVTCIVTGILMYYFLCVSFLWMNVMSIDIFRTFYSSTYRAKSRRIFIQYSLYAWLLPIGGLIVTVMVDRVWPDFILAPHFGKKACWFNNKWSLVAFFTFPSGMVILANLILYMVSVRNIYVQIKSGEMASSSKYSGKHPKQKNSMEPSSTRKKVSAAPDGKSNNATSSPGCKERLRGKFSRGFQRKHGGRLILYCKLALIMGMTWIFAFVSLHTKSIVFEYLFIIFNGLQGTFIFVSFDLKKKLWKDLWAKTSCRRSQPSRNCTVQGIKSCSLKTTLDDSCKNQCSSSQQFKAHSVSAGVSKTQPLQETVESEV